MATGETGFDDVSFDLVSVQYHSLKAGHDYGQYVRDARNAGYEDVASFFEQTMKEDSDRAARWSRVAAEARCEGRHRQQLLNAQVINSLPGVQQAVPRD